MNMNHFKLKLLSMYCRNDQSLHVIKYNVFLPPDSILIRKIITPQWSSSIHIHLNQLYRTFTRKGFYNIVDIVEFIK